ncbi:tRNA1(Val) (adenine(37)-N6)-methyltransferase [uncultured Tenacibaculum sp.]|uniref:tRNA1(Val) (adenine(37)-N6)-methyltransferase n=1 Tax=uncultured Tenacibaculum sp. TaxID=174713 RepID=UPI0026158E88|nr:methyltransferase [uncultured Tenacibaculum sp.]
MKPFKFKEFTVHQDKAAMKIGTDAVLLGAWSDINFYPDSILDIGSGTGVIALMLAQRTDAMTIDAIEIDEAAYEQSVENFERSEWGDRLFCYHASFQEFADEMQEDEETYDVIISNPPFYNAEFLSEDESRNKARFTNTALSFEELIKGVSVLLSETGEFNVIIPFEEEKSFVDLAKEHKLLVNRICRVKGNVNSELKRSLLAFSFEDKELIEEELVIEKERHQYTDAYIDLTKDFYLKM